MVSLKISWVSILTSFRETAIFAYCVGLNFFEVLRICQQFCYLVPTKISSRENLYTQKLIFNVGIACGVRFFEKFTQNAYFE